MKKFPKIKNPKINDNFLASLDDYQMELFIEFVLSVEQDYKKLRKKIKILENKIKD